MVQPTKTPRRSDFHSGLLRQEIYTRTQYLILILVYFINSVWSSEVGFVATLRETEKLRGSLCHYGLLNCTVYVYISL
jgi:uncharacterized membrane protein